MSAIGARGWAQQPSGLAAQIADDHLFHKRFDDHALTLQKGVSHQAQRRDIDIDATFAYQRLEVRV
jgi:hypothetical protein